MSASQPKPLTTLVTLTGVTRLKGLKYDDSGMKPKSELLACRHTLTRMKIRSRHSTKMTCHWTVSPCLDLLSLTEGNESEPMADDYDTAEKLVLPTNAYRVKQEGGTTFGARRTYSKAYDYSTTGMIA